MAAPAGWRVGWSATGVVADGEVACAGWQYNTNEDIWDTMVVNQLHGTLMQARGVTDDDLDGSLPRVLAVLGRSRGVTAESQKNG
jgi:hypothetical protein